MVLRIGGRLVFKTHFFLNFSMYYHGFCQYWVPHFQHFCCSFWKRHLGLIIHPSYILQLAIVVKFMKKYFNLSKVRTLKCNIYLKAYPADTQNSTKYEFEHFILSSEGLLLSQFFLLYQTTLKQWQNTYGFKSHLLRLTAIWTERSFWNFLFHNFLSIRQRQ